MGTYIVFHLMSDCSNCVCSGRSSPQVRRSCLRLRHGIASKRNFRGQHEATLLRRSKTKALSGSSSFDELDIKRVPFSERQAVMQALDVLGRSATAAEVASDAGLSISDTERCLQSLANESQGSLKVCCQGRRRAGLAVRHRMFFALCLHGYLPCHEPQIASNLILPVSICCLLPSCC